MAKHTLPNIGLTGGYAEGDSGWGNEQNANLLKLSALTQATVKGRVAAVPASPAEGDTYVLTAAPNNKAIAVFDGGEWIYWPPLEGWSVYDTQTNTQIRYDGAAWLELSNGGGAGGTGFLGSTVLRLQTDTNIPTGSWSSPPTANWQVLNDPLAAYSSNSDVVVPANATHVRCRAKTAWSNGSSTRAVRVAKSDDSDVLLLDIRGGASETASGASSPTQPVTAGSTLRVSYNTFQTAAALAGRAGTIFGRPSVVEFEWFNGWPQG